MLDKRLTTRLINYWELIKQQDELPVIGKLNSGAIADIWQHCLLLQSLPSASEEHTYNYLFCGDEISRAIGRDMTGQTLNTKMKFFPGAKIIRRIDEVANREVNCPLLDDGQFVNDNGAVVKYRACLLAFTQANSNTISHILIGVSWRTF